MVRLIVRFFTTSTTRLLAVLASAALALSLTACSSSPTSSNASASAPGATAVKGTTVVIKNFAFTPQTLTVRPGVKITVVNKDNVTHTLTSDSGVWDTGDIPGGTSAHFTAPSKPGRYPYRCTIHQFMTGTLIVS